MAGKSTILLDKETIQLLKKAKEHPRQSYDELIRQMSKHRLQLKKRNQYDEFLHKIQQPKMRELWDNKDDEVWDHV
jgi:hypothetical protein